MAEEFQERQVAIKSKIQDIEQGKYFTQEGWKPNYLLTISDKIENCFPMIPSGKPHNQMLLGPNDKKEKKITGKGKTLV